MIKKFLYIGQFPPPVHGVSYINTVIMNSKFINKKLDIIYYDYRFTNDISTIGKLKFKSILYFLKNIYGILKILSTEKRDVIFTIVPVGLAFYRDFILLSIVKLLFKIDFFLYIHAGNVNSFIQKNQINKLIYKYLSGFSNFIFLRQGLYKSLVVKIPNVSILNNFAPKIIQQKKKRNNKEIRLLFLSNFIENKGVLLAIDIFKKIVTNNKNIKCFLVGSDADLNKKQLQNQIGDGFRNQIKICGPKFGDEKYELMKTCNFFIFPSKYEREAFPVVVLEAVACGCLVINSSVNGINEIFDTEYISNKDEEIIEYFVNKINYFLQNKDKYDTEINKQNRILQSKYQLNVFEENFVKILNKV